DHDRVEPGVGPGSDRAVGVGAPVLAGEVGVGDAQFGAGGRDRGLDAVGDRGDGRVGAVGHGADVQDPGHAVSQSVAGSAPDSTSQPVAVTSTCCSNTKMPASPPSGCGGARIGSMQSTMFSRTATSSSGFSCSVMIGRSHSSRPMPWPAIEPTGSVTPSAAT